jgi:glycosyltransferase 2 family protein
VTIGVPAARSTMSRRVVWSSARLAAAAATIAVLVWRLGTGPFLDGLRTVEGGALAAAAGLAVLTTLCCAWRWRIVARGLGVDLPLGTAVAAYYRSLFLNVTLPGGMVGDLHRGISHGRDTSDVGRGLRAVAWERSAGQVVQVVLTVAVLLVMPSPVGAAMPLVALALLAAAAGVALAARVRPAGGRLGGSRFSRPSSAAARDLRDGLLAGRAWPAIALASALVVAGHAITFLIAARTAGATAPPSRMLPLVLLVMLAGAAQHRRMGAARGGDRLGVRRRRPRRVTRGRHRGRLWRDGVRRQPAGRRRPRGGVAAPHPAGAVPRAATPGRARGPRAQGRGRWTAYLTARTP